MTDREKAIVMAYTEICMLEGEKIDEFYHYLADLYGRQVYSHELITLDIKKKAKEDFVRLCREEEPEIIRCKDCKYYQKYRNNYECVKFTADPYEYLPMEPDDYCSRAERRTDETD